MLDVNSTILLIFLGYMHSELTFYFFYNRFWLLNSLMKNRILQKQEATHTNPHITLVLSILWLLVFLVKSPSGTYLICLSTAYFFLFFMLVISLFSIITQYWYTTLKVSNPYIFYIFLNMVYLLPFISLIDCYLTLFFFLELYSTLYYFFFLRNSMNTIRYYTINMKELITYYLWNSFLVNIIYSGGLLLHYKNWGSFKFIDLTLVNSTLADNFGLLLILIAFAWKLGIPGFHFYKIDLYKYLTLTNLLYFSLGTLIINIQFLLLILSIPTHLLFFTNTGLSLFIALATLIFTPQLFDNLTLYKFIAYSGVLTLMTVCVVYV